MFGANDCVSDCFCNVPFFGFCGKRCRLVCQQNFDLSLCLKGFTHNVTAAILNSLHLSSGFLQMSYFQTWSPWSKRPTNRPCTLMSWLKTGKQRLFQILLRMVKVVWDWRSHYPFETFFSLEFLARCRGDIEETKDQIQVIPSAIPHPVSPLTSQGKQSASTL